MAEVTAALVKELRTKSGAGMMDCKKALTESDGDIDAAVDWLRKKGLAAAAKKAGRVAAEGLIGAAVGDTAAALVEINAETDFVARNEQFQDLVRKVAEIALAEGDAELGGKAFPGTGRTVEEEITHAVATIGENMALRRALRLSVSEGVVASYIHNALTDSLGKIGVLVALESSGDKAVLNEFGRQLAMHVAATNPQSVDVADLDPAAIARERDVLSQQAAGSGKPQEIIDKMVEGRLRKFYQEVVLMEQTFVIDGETPVKKAVEAAAKKAGGAIKVTAIARYALGEGIERKEEDFAAEVAKAAG